MAGEETRRLGDEALLAALLAYSRCRDPEGLAKAAAAHFGGIPELGCATLRELRSIRGMDRRSALLLRLVGELSRRTAPLGPERRPVRCPADAARLLTGPLREAEGEALCCLCLDKLMRPASCCLICEGGAESVPSEPWSVYRAARGAGSRAVILAHSHPPDCPDPSAEDVERTRSLAEALGRAGVTLVDHIVISGTVYVSLAEAGILPNTGPIRQKYLEGLLPEAEKAEEKEK